jgi:hypothetical protein
MAKSKSNVNVNVRYVEKPNFEIHPLALNIPEMSNAQYQDCLEAVRKKGRIDNACVLYEDKLLDGRHRQHWAQELGLPLPVRDFDPAIDGDPEEFVYSQNEIRRHEEPRVLADRRYERRHEVKKLKEEGNSVRKISKKLKISKSQVQRDLDDAEAEEPQLSQKGTTETEPEVITGTDGKKYKSKTKEQKEKAKAGAAKKRQEKKPRLQIVSCDPIEEEIAQPIQDEAVVDSQENPVPERLYSAFHVAREIGKFAEQINSWRTKVRLWMDTCESWKDNGDDVLNDIDTLLDHLVDTTPTLVCPECKGESSSCDRCGGEGWLSYAQCKERAEDPSENWTGVAE